MLANLPDIDFLAGYIIGNPGAYHWGATHSLMGAVLAGGFFGLLIGSFSGGYAGAIALTTGAYASHIVLDMLLGHGQVDPTIGLQLFWPFSQARFMLPWSVFKLAPPSIATAPLGTLFSPEIIPVIARELLVILPAAVASWAFTHKLSSRSQ